MEKSQYEIMFEVEDNHFWYQGMRKITENLLEKYLKIQNNIKILDAGCGTGGSIIFLKKYGNVYGIDISDHAIKLCKKRGLTNVRTGSIDKLPYPNSSFDLVTCFDVLGQFEVKNDKEALNEIYRILKPGGLFLFRIAAYDWLRGYHDKLVHAKHRYTTEEVKKMVKNANFQLLKISYANSFLFPLIIFRRIIKLFFKKNHNQSDVVSVHPYLNSILSVPLLMEAYLLRFFNLPFGLSVIAVAKKIK